MWFQSSLFKISAALVSAVLLIFLINFLDTGSALFIRGSVLTVARPFLSLTGAVSHFFIARSGGLSQSDTAMLIQENQQLKAALFERELLRDEILRLRKALSFSEENKEMILGARVTFFGRDMGKEYLLIDQGKKAGVKEGDMVHDDDGALVGVVGEAGERFSKIEIASNPGRTFEVEFEPIHVRALARGIGAGTFTLELIPSDAPIAVGDFIKVISAGGTRLSFLLGAVAEVHPSGGAPFQEARAVLLVRPKTLSEVFVVRK